MTIGDLLLFQSCKDFEQVLKGRVFSKDGFKRGTKPLLKSQKQSPALRPGFMREEGLKGQSFFLSERPPNDASLFQ